MSHYDNDYYILVFFYVNKADVICLLASPNSPKNFKLIGWCLQMQQIGRSPKDISAT